MNDKLDQILDLYYAPIKMPDANREGLKQSITTLFKEMIAEAKPNTVTYTFTVDKSTPDISVSPINQLEQNLIKLLEEV